MELIKLENEIAVLDPEVSKQIADFERQIKTIKEQEDNLKQAILEEMETNQIVKLDTPDILISYIAPTDRETFDSKTFKAEHQDLYDEYVKMTPVKSSVRIKVK
jgi:regulator of replication initiation timing